MAVLSLAIPTNGVAEWIFPVLDSIYEQDVDENVFEVIVTDNGKDDSFCEKMNKYKQNHTNLIYERNETKMFMNQIEAFKLASGDYIKFVNHRTKLREGVLKHLLKYVEDNSVEKPITYFLNGTETTRKQKNIVSGFDSYVYELSYKSSWSGGVGCWKSDFDALMQTGEILKYNGLFPHLAFVFLPKSDRQYKVDTTKLFEEIPNNGTKKGNYDLFRAFGVDYISKVKSLLDDKVIVEDTYEHVKEDNQAFIENLYAEYVVMRKKNSYDLSSAEVSLNQYYSYDEIRRKARTIALNRVLAKVKRIVRRK